MEEINKLQYHGVYEKVPQLECREGTGRSTMEVKWIDFKTKLMKTTWTSGVDKSLNGVSEERLVRCDSTNKSFFSFAVTDGTGYSEVPGKSGMKLDFIDTSRADSQAAAISEVYGSTR